MNRIPMQFVLLKPVNMVKIPLIGNLSMKSASRLLAADQPITLTQGIEGRTQPLLTIIWSVANPTTQVRMGIGAFQAAAFPKF